MCGRDDFPAIATLRILSLDCRVKFTQRFACPQHAQALLFVFKAKI